MQKSTIALVLGFALAGCATDRDPERIGAPAGRLGHPLGTYLQIEGVRLEKGKSGDQSLLVDRVGDREISPPVGVWIENVALPPDVRCVLRGYESGRWIGIPDEVLAAEGLGRPQAVWQFSRRFIATSVQAPQSLVDQFRESGGRHR